MKFVPHLTIFPILGFPSMVDEEVVNDGTKHQSDSTQLEKLEDDRRQHAALVSQTRVSPTLQNLLNSSYLQSINLNL